MAEPHGGAIPSASEVENAVQRVMSLSGKFGAKTSKDEALAELAARAYSVDETVKAFARRHNAEQAKSRGNELFSAGNFDAALREYAAGLELVAAGGVCSSAAGARLLAVLKSNRSACFLSLRTAEEAADEARAAVAQDQTFEKGFLRLGAAYEALNRRAEALEAYRRVSTNEVAAKRIAVLEAPPIMVKAEGLVGVPEGSLDLRDMAPCADPTEFFGILGKRILLPSEELTKLEMRRSSRAFDYCVRTFYKEFFNIVGQFHQDARSNHMMTQGDQKLWFDVIGSFVVLPNVADDGRPRHVSHNSPDVPVLFVALWTGKGAPRKVRAKPSWDNYGVDLERMKAMLLRNASLVSESCKRRVKVDPGFVLTVMTHVAPDVDYAVLEGCSVPGCTVECAGNRCGRCLVTRYCGKEHMTAHWREHKPHCVPLAQRQRKLTLDCSRWYMDDPSIARYGIEPVPVPRKTFPGLVVIKIITLPGFMYKLCDPHGVFLKFITRGESGFAEMLEMFPKCALDHMGMGFGYFDADMSQEGRLVVYLDRSWKCIW
jgi:hypothetical protein